MKYFTDEWWNGGCSDERPIHEYRTYFASIEAELPKDIVELEHKHTLHDSRVQSIICNLQDRSVLITLAGWNQAFQQRANYVLTFGGVEVFNQHLPIGTRVKRELGDLGYWEYELRAGKIEMRMLFESGAELSLQFITFSFSRTQSAAQKAN